MDNTLSLEFNGRKVRRTAFSKLQSFFNNPMFPTGTKVHFFNIKILLVCKRIAMNIIVLEENKMSSLQKAMEKYVKDVSKH